MYHATVHAGKWFSWYKYGIGKGIAAASPRQGSGEPNLPYIALVVCNRGLQPNSIFFKQGPLLHDKSAYPLSIVKNISISYSMWQGLKYKMKILIHIHLVPCLYRTDCMWSTFCLSGFCWWLGALCLQKESMPEAANLPGWGPASWREDGRVPLSPGRLWKLMLHFPSNQKKQESTAKVSLFILMNSVLKHMAIKQEVYLFRGFCLFV